MKQINRFSILLLAGLVFVFSCAKEQADNRKELASGNESEEVQAPAGKPVTISALLADAMTKVDFDPAYADGKTTSLALTWNENDKLIVADHANPASSAEFALVSGAGEKKAVFEGTAPAGATSYDVSVKHGDMTIASQTQPADADASGLQYMASKTGITDLSTIVFDNVNSVLAITAKMPSTAVAAAIDSVTIKAFGADGITAANIFGNGNKLRITIGTPGDTAADGILNLFAMLPEGNQEVAAGTQLLVHFYAPGSDHTVYTRFVELPASTFTAGKLNTINVNASQSDKHAGLPTCDGTSADKAYLIGDKYQMDYLHTAMTSGTTYVKMVDDVDLTGVSWVSLNNASGYDKAVNYDGNGKIISNLNAPLFDDLNGVISNLSISQTTLTELTGDSGILANTVKTAASTITDVELLNCSIISSGYTGGLVGHTTASVELSGVDVNSTNVTGSLTGGVVGYLESPAIMTDCHYNGGTILANNQYCGGIAGATGPSKTIGISDCSVKAASLSSAYNRMGGVIGAMRSGATIERTVVGESSAHVEITSTGDAACYVGGFVGLMEGGEIKDNCCAYVNLTGVKQSIGGFIGRMTAGKVSGGKSFGSVSGPGTIGGFFGDVTNATEISGNQSQCSVTATSTYVGGFVGRLAGSISCSSCSHSHGKVVSTLGNAKEVYLGGFAGYIGSKAEAFTGTISRCSVTSAEVDGVLYDEKGAAVSSGKWVGGFAGGIGHATSANNTGKILKCSVHASEKRGGQYTGGFAGVSYSTIEKCKVSGQFTVQGYGASVGGFCGYQNGHSVSYCYTNAKPRTSNKNYVGGFIGNANSTEIIECYSSGDITGNSSTTGGMIGLASSVTCTRLIRWNHSNNNTIIAGETSTPSGCYVKTSSDSNFQTKAASLGWSTDGTIWSYPSGGGIPSLVDVQ